MKTFNYVIERCPETKSYMGYVPGFPGAHSVGDTLEELRENMRECLEMLLEEGEPKLEGEFVGTEQLEVATCA